MGAPGTIRGRYEIREVLGQGGMGVVYAAYDRVVRRLVAVKTIRDIPDPLALELFERESQVLADLSHPNIVEMFDIGEFSDDGFTKPYFVMPLLRGATLDQLMRAHKGGLPPSRAIDIITQACRGLYAAHESGLVHRDLKPSNIFVLEDDSVKIIDFGVAHLLANGTTFGAKGTPHYVAPEQIEQGGASPLSDQFSMAVVAYELLTRKLPFQGASAREIGRAILNSVPTPVFEANPAISLAVSQVIAKGLAKKPAHRFGTIKEFSEALQRAFLTNKPLPIFDERLLLPRVERAERALAAGDLAFAEEITADLEDEGSLHAAVSALRRKIEAEKRRAGIERLLAEARHRLGESEYSLALEKVTEALRLDENNQAAQELRAEVENRRDERRIEQWLELARRSREARDFDRAHENLSRILQLRPEHAEAQRLAAELKTEEAEFRNCREERDRLYRAALHAWREGDLTIALDRLERARRIDPDRNTTELVESYRKLREEVEQLTEAQKQIGELIARGEGGEALAACRDWLQRYPAYPVLEALRLRALEERRKQMTRYIAQVDARVAAEKDLEKRVQLLEEAAARYPDEPHFHEAAASAREHRDIVRRLERKAAQFENAHEWAEALEQWNLIAQIHPEHPGIAENRERLQRRSEQYSQAEEKARWVRRIDRELEADRFEAAVNLISQAKQRFPGDAELDELENLAVARTKGRERVEQLLAEAARICEGDGVDACIRAVHEARAVNPADAALNARTAQLLMRQAQRLVTANPAAAEQLLREASAIDPNAAGIREIERKLAEHSREERVSALLAQARRYQSEGNLPQAMVAVQQGLADYPTDPRLESLLGTLKRSFEQNRGFYEKEAEQLAAVIGKGEASEEQRRHLTLLETLLGRAPQAAAALETQQAKAAEQLHSVSEPELVPAMEKPRTARLYVWAAAVAAGAALLSVGVLLLRQSTQQITPSRQRAAAHTSVAAPGASLTPINSAPPGPVLLVRTDSPDDTVSIDSRPDEPLAGSSLDLNGLSAGKHQLAITDAGGRRASFEFDTSDPQNVAAPRVTGKGLVAVSGHIDADAITVAASQPNIAASVDQSGYRRVGAAVRLPLQSHGAHVLTFADGAETWSMPLPDTAARKYFAIVHSLRGGGMLINAGQDDADVYIDGVKLRRRTRNGVLHVSNLPPRSYQLKVSKDGFEDRSGTVTVETGKEASIDLPLTRKAAPASATLEIANGTPGAQVLVDGQAVAEIGANGQLADVKLAPGKHEIAISKARYAPKSRTYTVKAGDKLQLSEEQAKLEQTPVPPGTVRFEVTPAHASVSVKGAGANVARGRAGEILSLPAGVYEVSVSAPGFVSRNLTLELASGETKELPVRLNPLEEHHPPADILSGWEDTGSWIREGSTAVRRGGGMVFYSRTNLTGSIHFQAELRRGKRLQWFLHFKGPENYCRFEADKHTFYRSQIVNGKSRAEVKKNYFNGDGKDFSVEIVVRRGSVVHRINGQTVDTWNDPQVDFADGTFGFIVPGRNSGFPLLGGYTEIALRSFSFSRSPSLAHLSENIAVGR